MATLSVTNEAIDDYLREAYKDLRDDGSPKSMARVYGAIHALRELRLLSTDQAELWELRLDRCPGHDGEGGRVWCAYCGDMCRSCGEPLKGPRCPSGEHCLDCCPVLAPCEEGAA